jgi:hypothetical protein
MARTVAELLQLSPEPPAQTVRIHKSLLLSALIGAGPLWLGPTVPAVRAQEPPPAKPVDPKQAAAEELAELVKQLGDPDPAEREFARKLLRRKGRAAAIALADAWIAGAAAEAGAVPELVEFNPSRRRQREAWELLIYFFPGLAFSPPDTIKPDTLRGYVKFAQGREALEATLPADVAVLLRTGGKGLPAALRSAAGIASPAAAAGIRAWLTKGSGSDRVAACIAAIHHGDATLRAQAEPILREGAAAEVALDLRLQVATGLSWLGSADGAATCAEALRAGSESQRILAAAALARLEIGDLIAVVRPWMAGDDPKLAALAAGILVAVGKKAIGDDFLQKAMAGKDEKLRSAAAKVVMSLEQGAKSKQQRQLFEEQIAVAVERGVKYLRETQRGDGTWESIVRVVPERGVTALAMLALLKSGIPTEDETVLRALKAVRAPTTAAVNGPYQARAYEQYVWGVEIMALAATGEPAYRPVIQDRATALMKRQHRGAWDYYDDHDGGTGPRGGDTSMVQIALLGLREAANAGVRIPPGVWRKSLDWVRKGQLKDGGFLCEPYWIAKHHGKHHLVSATGMTAAGVSCLLICREQLGKKVRAKEREAIDEAVARASKRIGDLFSARPDTRAAGHHTWHHYYYLYGLERAGTLANRTVFGERNWYEEGAAYILSSQNADGGWAPRPDTPGLPKAMINKSSALQAAFALLFLRRATRPILTFGGGGGGGDDGDGGDDEKAGGKKDGAGGGKDGGGDGSKKKQE